MFQTQQFRNKNIKNQNYFEHKTDQYMKLNF